MMNKTYIILIGPKYDRDQIISFLEKSGSINNWFYSLPYSFFVKSIYSSEHLFQLISDKFGEAEKILITEISYNNRAGRIPKNQHHLFTKT